MANAMITLDEYAQPHASGNTNEVARCCLACRAPRALAREYFGALRHGGGAVRLHALPLLVREARSDGGGR
eukprot:6174444-Pleurochrysis_carterae.AAC.2